MTGFRLAYLSVVRRPVASAVAVLCVCAATLSSGILISVVSARTSLLDGLDTDFEIAIGPKSSGLAVLLGSLGVREPSDDVLPYALVEYIDRRAKVKNRVPLHLCGNVDGFSVFGVDDSYLVRDDEQRAPTVTEGSWTLAEGEAILGAKAARVTGKGVGDRIEIHGRLVSPTDETDVWETEAVVAGVLDHGGGPMDGSVFVPLSTSWSYYRWARERGLVRDTKKDRAFTYLLVSIDEQETAFFERKLHGGSVAQMVKIPEELAFLRSLVEGGRWAGRFLCAAVIALAILGIGALSNARFDSLKPELGVLRALGYRRRRVAGWIVTESALLVAAGVILAAPIETLLVGGLDLPYRMAMTEVPTAWPTSWNFAIWGFLLLSSVAASALPLYRLYRTDAHTALKGV